jgi:hypothetical protein
MAGDERKLNYRRAGNAASLGDITKVVPPVSLHAGGMLIV